MYATHSTTTAEQRDRSCNKTASSLMLTKKHKYNKEHFLQANCQFVVKSTGDYKQYINNPDALVDWGLIEQVNVQVAEFPSCPICLYPPVAAKMTRCGHIYCWSCVLHYLSLTDKTWRKCPICYEAVHKEDLKSVVSIPHNTFNVNDIITFKLMKRLKGSLTAYPATATNRTDDVIFNMSEKDASQIYSKLLLANQDEIFSIINREENELKVQLKANLDCPENCFVEQALVLLAGRKNLVLELESNGNGVKIMKPEENSNNESISFETNEDEDGDGNTPPGFLDMSGSSSVNQQAAKFHYFYQGNFAIFFCSTKVLSTHCLTIDGFVKLFLWYIIFLSL